jgi:hypothetical protein
LGGVNVRSERLDTPIIFAGDEYESVGVADLAASFSTGMAHYPWMITEKAIARGSAPDTSFA